MDLKKYSKYFTNPEVLQMLKDIEQSAGSIVSELPPIQQVQNNTRYLVNTGSGLKEYIKLNGEYHELGSSGSTIGKEIELRKSTTHIQWRYKGEETWYDLVSLEDITGADGEDGTDGTNGREIELQTTDTNIQWRYEGENIWINLITLNELRGKQGETGPGVPSGGTSGQVLKKIDSTDYNTEWSNQTGGEATTLDSLTDVDTSGVTNGQVLKYDSISNKWIPGTITALAGFTTNAGILTASICTIALSNFSTKITLTAV